MWLNASWPILKWSSSPVAAPAWTLSGFPRVSGASMGLHPPTVRVVVVLPVGAEHHSALSLYTDHGSVFRPFLIALLQNDYSKTHFQFPER